MELDPLPRCDGGMLSKSISADGNGLDKVCIRGRLGGQPWRPTLIRSLMLFVQFVFFVILISSDIVSRFVLLLVDTSCDVDLAFRFFEA